MTNTAIDVVFDWPVTQLFYFTTYALYQDKVREQAMKQWQRKNR